MQSFSPIYNKNAASLFDLRHGVNHTKSVFGLQRIDMILLLETLFVLTGADKHHLGKVTVLLILEAGDLFSGADRTADDRDLRLRIVGLGLKASCMRTEDVFQTLHISSRAFAAPCRDGSGR